MPVVSASVEEELAVIDITSVRRGDCVAFRQHTHWSSTMTSSCWVYCCASRKARSLASELYERHTRISDNFIQGFCIQTTIVYLPRIDEVEDRQVVVQAGSQALGIQDNVVMQESRICVQNVHLRSSSFCYRGMAMTHCRRRQKSTTFTCAKFSRFVVVLKSISFICKDVGVNCLYTCVS